MPVRENQLDSVGGPLDVLARWPADRPVVLLHSGRHDPHWATKSIIAEPVGRYVLSIAADDARDVLRARPTGVARWIGDDPLGIAPRLTGQPFADLRTLTQCGGDGLWVGSMSYDLGRWVEVLPTHATGDRAWPVIELAYCPTWWEHDGASGRWRRYGTTEDRNTIAMIDGASDAAHGASVDAAPPVSNFTRDGYERAIAKAIDYIAAGDVFQVNLAQRMTSQVNGAWPATPRALFARLAHESPAWYGAYLEWPGDSSHRAVLSTSPELFLQIDADRRVVTRPIKGTRPADVAAEQLRASVKDQAELNMIVDLMRNDLGRVCDYGSVRVADARAIESHPTVHHGVATIEGRLHATKDIVDLLRATLPGGSVTGAPKVRAMQIIDELEPVRRGLYCGAIGWLTRDAMCLSVAIRTMLYEQMSPRAGRVDFSVGGGIVADSRPDAEYQETLDKAAAMIAALHLPVSVP